MSGHKTVVSPKRMKADFELVKQKIRIEDIANYLLGEDVRGMYKFPQERTASIKIYSKTQSFFDYGRGTGGDAICLWAYIRQVDAWTALNEIKTLYGFTDKPNKVNIRQKIRQQEQDRQAAKRAEEKRKEQWRNKVNSLKAELTIYENLLASEHIPPLSWVWCECKNQKQIVEYRLDWLCGICD